MVRAERDGSLLRPFLERGIAAIGWAEIGDVSDIASYKEATARVSNIYPDISQTAQQLTGGMIFRISKEIKKGDYILTYDKQKRVYFIGQVTEGYKFLPEIDPEYPHTISVNWFERSISRDELRTGTKNTLGSSLTLFLLNDEAANDVLASLSPERSDSDTVDSDIVEDDPLRDVEARSIEFIKDAIVRLNWDEMQQLVAGMLRAMGYKTRISPAGPDRGKDIVASPDGFGFEDPRIVVEVKHRPGTTMGSSEIRGFLGGRHQNDKGLYVSTGGFTKDAQYEAERANIPLALMDLDQLVSEIINNYEKMDVEAQRLIPLKRFYWPISQ